MNEIIESLENSQLVNDIDVDNDDVVDVDNGDIYTYSFVEGEEENDNSNFNISGESLADKLNRVNHHRQIFETHYCDKYRPTELTATHLPLSDAVEDNFLPFFKKSRIELPMKNEVEIFLR